MAQKTIEPVAVEVDEAALTLLGWTVVNAQARLVTATGPGGAVSQRIAVAGTVHFDATHRTEHSNWSDTAPRVLLALSRRGSVSPPSFTQVVAERADIAARRPVRFTETSEAWSGSAPTAPEDLLVRLTGYDLDNVDRFFSLPGSRSTALPITVLDEGTWPSLAVEIQSSAEISHEEYGDQLRVHIEGVVTPGTVEELLADHVSHDPAPLDSLFKVPHLPVPGFVVEVTDDTDFLLAKRTIRFDGSVTADDTNGTLRRALRFLAGFRTPTSTYAGTPAQIVLRIRDATELRSI